MISKETKIREFPSGPVVRTQCFHCCGPGSIPGQGTQIPQAMQYRKKKKNYTGLFFSFRHHASKKSGVKYLVLKGKEHQPIILYPMKLASKTKEEMKTFSDKPQL